MSTLHYASIRSTCKVDVANFAREVLEVCRSDAGANAMESSASKRIGVPFGAADRFRLGHTVAVHSAQDVRDLRLEQKLNNIYSR